MALNEIYAGAIFQSPVLYVESGMNASSNQQETTEAQRPYFFQHDLTPLSVDIR